MMELFELLKVLCGLPVEDLTDMLWRRNSGDRQDAALYDADDAALFDKDGKQLFVRG